MLALVSTLLFALSLGTSAQDTARGSWLCRQVGDFQASHPHRNVIAFSQGTYQFYGPLDAKEIKYEVNGCDEGVGGLGSAIIGGQVGSFADRVGPAVLPGVGRTMGDAIVNRINYCLTFKLVAFSHGIFRRDGPGGFENWCFRGKI